MSNNFCRAGEVRDAANKFIGRYVYLDDQKQLDLYATRFLESWDQDQRFFITFDLETTCLNPIDGDILLGSCSWDGRSSFVFEPRHFDLTLWKECLEKVNVSNQRIQFDSKWIFHHWGVWPNIWFDTMVAAQLAWAGAFPSRSGNYTTYGHRNFGLGNLAQNILEGFVLDKTTRDDFVTGVAGPDLYTDEHIRYSASDALITHRLVHPIKSRLYNVGLLDFWETVELPFIQVMTEAEYYGIPIDVGVVQKSLENYDDTKAELLIRLNEAVSNLQIDVTSFPKKKFNPNSGPQIVKVLAALGYQVLSTEAAVLKNLEQETKDPVVRDIIGYREAESYRSKFPKKWLDKSIHPKTGRIYTSLHTYGAATGRLASSDPNMMTVPEILRPAVIAPEDSDILASDYSQFEFRAVAARADEPYLLKAFFDREALFDDIKKLALEYGFIDPDTFVKKVEGGKVQTTASERLLVDDFASTDIHRRNAALVFGIDPKQVSGVQRTICKTLGYAALYGAGVSKITDQLAGVGIIVSDTESGSFLERFFQKLPYSAELIRETHLQVERLGWVETHLGRKRFFELPPRWKPQLRATAITDARREAVNFLFQGANADALKLAGGRCYVRSLEQPESERIRLMLTVHDEILFQVPKVCPRKELEWPIEIMIEAGREATGYKVPIECSMQIGPAWSK